MYILYYFPAPLSKAGHWKAFLGSVTGGEASQHIWYIMILWICINIQSLQKVSMSRFRTQRQSEAYIRSHGVGCLVTDLECVGRGSYSIYSLVLSDLILSTVNLATEASYGCAHALLPNIYIYTYVYIHIYIQYLHIHICTNTLSICIIYA